MTNPKLIITDDMNVLDFVTDAVLTVRRIELATAEAYINAAFYGEASERPDVHARLTNGVIVDALNHARSFGTSFSMKAVAPVPVELRGGDAVLLVTLKPDKEFDQFDRISPTYIVAHNMRYLSKLDEMLTRAVNSLIFRLLEVEIEVEILGENHEVELTSNINDLGDVSH